MKRKIAVLLCCILLLSSLVGCQLAREDAGVDSYADKLIGVFVTTEHLDLFDSDSYLDDNLAVLPGGDVTLGGNTQKYQGRLYAQLTPQTPVNGKTGGISERKEYVFPDVEGFSYFAATVPAEDENESYITFTSDPAVNHVRTDVHIGDEVSSQIMEAMIYASPIGRQHIYYFNPVYQSSDGSVYALTGSGMSFQEAEIEGMVMSGSIDSTFTTTENGKIKTESISVKLSVSLMFTPEKILLLQMDKDSGLLSRTEYAPGALPETLSPQPEAAYIIVETHKRDTAGGDAVERHAYGKDAESIETFFVRDDGVCIKLLTQIQWPEPSPSLQLIPATTR